MGKQCGSWSAGLWEASWFWSTLFVFKIGYSPSIRFSPWKHPQSNKQSLDLHKLAITQNCPTWIYSIYRIYFMKFVDWLVPEQGKVLILWVMKLHYKSISLQSSYFSLTLKAPIATKVACFSCLLKCLGSLYGKQCGPRSDCSGSTLLASILNSSVMLGNYLQQTTSADYIFRCIFFLAL